MNHWDESQPFLSVHNIMALARAAFLTCAEYVFFVGDFRMMNAKKTVKKVTCALVLTSLAACMTWVIGEEWASSASKEAGKTGLAAVSNIQQEGLQSIKRSSAQAKVTTTALEKAAEITKGMTQASTRAYQVSFFFALLGFIILHFCVEHPNRRTVGKGNVLPTNPELAAHVSTLNLPQGGGVKAYALADGSGYSIFCGGKYAAFVKASDIGGSSQPAQPQPKRRAGFI